MSRRAFIDFRENEVSVYFSGKNGKGGFSSDWLSAPVGEGYAFSLSAGKGDIDKSFLSLPLSLLNFRVVELPFSDIRKIRELLPFEIDGLILGGSRNVVFDAVVLGKSNGNFRVLAAYLPKETMRALLDRLKSQGFDPVFVTSIELAHLLSFGSGEDIADRLFCPPALACEDRLNTALKEMESPTVDLRRDEFSYTVDAEKTAKSLKTAGVLLALLIAIFISDMAITIFSTRKENTALRDDIRRTYLALFPDEKKITSETYQLKAHIKELEEKKDSFIGVSPLQAFLDLSRISRPGLVINEITLDREIIVLKGECPTMTDVQNLRNDLEGIFSDVVISDTKPSVRNRSLFTITAKEKKA